MKSFGDRNNNASEQKHFINHQIRAPKVLCIDAENKNRGVIPTHEALRLAQDSQLDLVMIENPKSGHPICKILDYGKFKYENSKKDKLAKKKQRESTIEIKEIKFRPSTAENDLKIKAKQASKFLEDGDKVKVSIMFHGREISHKEVGTKTLDLFLSFIPDACVISAPELNGRDLVAVLERKITSSDRAKSA